MSTTRRTLWQSLTDPHQSIQTVHVRRQGRVLAGLSILLLLLSLALLLWELINTGGVRLNTAATPVLLLVAYIFSRTANPQVGALILTFGVVLVNFAFLILTQDAAATAQTIFILLLPILASTIVASTRITIYLSAVVLIGLLGLAVLTPWLALSDVGGALLVTLLVSALSIVLATIQEQDRSTIQQQARDITRYGEELENEIDQRTQRILATAEVARAITGTRDLDTLLRRVVNLIIDNLDFYHAQVFLVDEKGTTAVLRASTGPAGKQLLEQRHQMPVGSRSVIGQVTERGTPVITRDSDTDVLHRRNELLPLTRSELALPLRVESRIIGALDIQSTNPNAFGETLSL
ncbi:MAG: GAF domain-containing protein, partial [Chloroflexi bacterium]|nr:GAF domain-containing protein [Chloroflexota bacterium]